MQFLIWFIIFNHTRKYKLNFTKRLLSKQFDKLCKLFPQSSKLSNLIFSIYLESTYQYTILIVYSLSKKYMKIKDVTSIKKNSLIKLNKK